MRRTALTRTPETPERYAVHLTAPDGITRVTFLGKVERTGRGWRATDTSNSYRGTYRTRWGAARALREAATRKD